MKTPGSAGKENRFDGYTVTAIVLHWTTAALIVSAAVLGIYMHELAFSPLKLRLYSYHKWIGVTVFLLALCRFAWRSSHPAPSLSANMPSWESKAAKAAHFSLYVLMIAVPAAGWLMSSAHGFQTVYLGVLPIPDLLGKDKETAEVLAKAHALLNLTLISLVFAHAAAAFKHHFINRDDVLNRMTGFRRSRG